MVLHGREVKMAFPVGAMQDVAEICPNKDIRRMAELFDMTDDSKPIDFGTIIKIASVLSYWGEEQYAFFHPDYEARPFTEHELKMLSSAEIQALFVEAVSTITNDSARTIETESVDPKKE